MKKESEQEREKDKGLEYFIQMNCMPYSPF